MEEEVLLFDGGDLGRMKKKTRGMPVEMSICTRTDSHSCYLASPDTTIDPSRFHHTIPHRPNR
jgi:hypothetical protein